jgi:hypothetical protein
MSFKEKVAWVMLVIMVLVYGRYFYSIQGAIAGGVDVAEIPYRAAMLMTVVTVVVLAIAATIAVTIAARGDDASDERDSEIERHGDWLGGIVLYVGVLGALALAMFEAAHFWIANALLLSLVLAEIVAGVRKLTLYRRGI